jgi:hypothetical protein
LEKKKENGISKTSEIFINYSVMRKELALYKSSATYQITLIHCTGISPITTQSMPGPPVQHISTCLYLLPTSLPIFVYLQSADWF